MEESAFLAHGKFQSCTVFVAGVFFPKRKSFDDDEKTLFVHEAFPFRQNDSYC